MKTVAGDQFMGVGQSGDAIYRDSLEDELRRIELAAILKMMRENQRPYEQDRQRLLYALRP